MKIAFKKNGSSFFAKIISWWTKSIYYHCEIVFEDGTAFSANIEPFKNFGTRFIKFDLESYDKNTWELFEIPINTSKEEEIKEWCKQEDGCLYDILGIFLTQVIPLSFQNPYWWFCSEICCSALQIHLDWFKNKKAHELNPSEFRILLHHELVKNGYNETWNQY